jgi:hypothetical protein
LAEKPNRTNYAFLSKQQKSSFGRRDFLQLPASNLIQTERRAFTPSTLIIAMRKPTLALAALALFFVLASIAGSGKLSILCGLIAAGLGITAGIVQSAEWVDEHEYFIPNPDASQLSRIKSRAFISNTQLAD